MTTKTSKQAAAPKAAKSVKAPKATPSKKAEATKPVAKKAKATNGEAKAKKLSALDAAAQVLAHSGEPLNAKQLIEAMAAKNLWSSPGGKTPSQTLYSAITREITIKGDASRFKKAERGQFTANG